MKRLFFYVKFITVGLIMGVIGVIIGAVPILYLRMHLDNFLISIYGSFSAVPDIIHYLVFGLGLPLNFAIFLLPIGGALFGIIGAIVGLIRRSKRIWLWGGVAGFLFNFLVSFHAQ